MDADSSIELGPSAPALEIPWADPEGRVQYFDLCRDPDALAQNLRLIPEAQQYPALRDFLKAVNSPPSPWQSAKCDVWCDESDPSENLFAATFAQSSYVDLVLTDGAVDRDDLKFHQETAEALAYKLESDEDLTASAEIVVRRCYFHRDSTPEAMNESIPGYCLTLFLTGYGASCTEAAESWDHAINFAAACLLALPLHESRELS